MINKGFTECPYNKDQLDKLFDLEKLGKITDAKSFLFDCNEAKECKKVMTEMAEAINVVLKAEKKAAEKAKKEKEKAEADKKK